MQRGQDLICDSVDDIKMGVLSYIVQGFKKLYGTFASEYVHLKYIKWPKTCYTETKIETSPKLEKKILTTCLEKIFENLVQDRER